MEGDAAFWFKFKVCCLQTNQAGHPTPFVVLSSLGPACEHAYFDLALEGTDNDTRGHPEARHTPKPRCQAVWQGVVSNAESNLILRLVAAQARLKTENV